MNRLKDFFSIYGGLKREVYILAFGRVVTSMGALIWPMLTLILSNKLGFAAGEIGLALVGVGLISIPMNLLGGKLADRFNKKMIIVVFDTISIIAYIICGCMELSLHAIYIYFIGSIFQSMEHPAYDALIADLTSGEERERAYSLNYLSMNLGLVLSPMIGGILFENHLNLAFIISGVAISLSTIIIFLFVKDIAIENKDAMNSYEKEETGSVISILSSMPLLYVFFLILGVASIIYAQFNFLIPLTMDEIFQAKSAFYFGMLTSVNAFVVIIGTPLLTSLCKGIRDLYRLQLGHALQILGLSLYIFIRSSFMLCIFSMIIFTIGEILVTLSNTPYLTKRIPSSHRGRILSISSNVTYVAGGMANIFVGKLADVMALQKVWIVIFLLGCILMIIYVFYHRLDHKTYAKLYE